MDFKDEVDGHFYKGNTAESLGVAGEPLDRQKPSGISIKIKTSFPFT